MSRVALLFIGLTILFTVAGQIMVKWGVQNLGAGPGESMQLIGYLVRAFTSWRIIAGVAFGALAAFSWTLALSRSDLSAAYPFMALAIVLVLALSPMLFEETVSLTRWLGVLVVCAGLWLGSRG